MAFGTDESVLFIEVSSFQESSLERFHCIFYYECQFVSTDAPCVKVWTSFNPPVYVCGGNCSSPDACRGMYHTIFVDLQYIIATFFVIIIAVNITYLWPLKLPYIN